MAAALLAYATVAPYGWAALPVAVLVATLGSLLVVNLQLWLMDVAGEAQTLGAALNHSSLNVANALGAWLGGLVRRASAIARRRWSGWGCRSPASPCWSFSAWPRRREAQIPDSVSGTQA